ncbi:hypothetical protein JCM17042A_19720 [Ruminococcus champanellensis 18P13 = JCM 17042]
MCRAAPSAPQGFHPPCTLSYNFFSLVPVYDASNKQHAGGGNHPACGKQEKTRKIYTCPLLV